MPSTAPGSSRFGPAAFAGPGPSSQLHLSARLHLHTSVISHLSTELSMLHALILRARDQHRTQLFLRRMYEVLRIGKHVLGFARQWTRPQDELLTDRKSSAWLKGEKLVRRLLQTLLTAYRFAAQIIDLHHFLPLQTSCVAIYARLFTLTLNIASALGMDVEGLILSGGGAQKRPEAGHDLDNDQTSTGPVHGGVNSVLAREPVSTAGSISTLDELGVGLEVGEKVERGVPVMVPVPKPSTSERTNVAPAPKANVESPMSVHSPAQSASESSAGETASIGMYNVHGSPERSPAIPVQKVKASQSFATEKPLKLALESAMANPATRKEDRTEASPSNDAPKPKKKLKSTADHDGGIQSTEKRSGDRPKKKKKKKDDLDDIFGF
ncbi:hypothetical protein IAU60_002783 [Kwoniella sp. DSM 27419]